MGYFNCTILIDDDPITNYINSKVITKAKLSPSVKVASNGREGLQLIKEYCMQDNGCPELVLLDLNMPVMSGFEFLEEFHKIHCDNRQNIIIIVLTTSSHTTDINRVQQCNIAGYLNKPLSLEKLIDMMQKVFPDFNTN